MTHFAAAHINAVRRMIAGGLLAPCLALSAWARPQQPAQNNMPHNQKAESRHLIDRLEERWRDAVLKNDVAALDALMAEDYVGIRSNGTLETKDQALDRYRKGQWHVTSMDYSDRKVRFYGRTAVVTSVVQTSGTNDEGPLDGMYRYTRVYVRDARGNYLIVNFEASRIRSPHDREHALKDHN
jgi:ketosteroid isomerase-like protein